MSSRVGSVVNLPSRAIPASAERVATGLDALGQLLASAEAAGDNVDPGGLSVLVLSLAGTARVAAEDIGCQP